MRRASLHRFDEPRCDATLLLVPEKGMGASHPGVSLPATPGWEAFCRLGAAEHECSQRFGGVQAELVLSPHFVDSYPHEPVN